MKEVKSMLELKTSAYWDRHYVFDELSSNSKKKLGKEMISNILINSILPALFSYGHLNKEEALMKTSLDWMESIDVEHNSLLELWKNFGITASNAFDSQALLELRTRYCNPKRCLDCAVGNNLFKKQLDP